MAKKPVSVTQRGVIYGEITEASIKDATVQETGDLLKIYSFKVKEKDSGVLITCEKVRNLTKMADESEGMKAYMNSVIDLINKVKNTPENTPIKCKVAIYPSNDKGTLKQYTFLTTDITDEGSVYFKLGTSPKEITTEKDFLEYENKKSYFTSTMPLEDVDTENLTLKFIYLPPKGKEKVLLTHLPEEYSEHIFKYEVGAGYEVKLEFKKGVKREIENGTFEFDEEEKTANYEPNKLMIVASTPVSNIEGSSANNTDVF
jgi:hypothetical protein